MQGLSGAQVSLPGENGGSTSTTADGAYGMNLQLSPGVYTLTAGSDGHASQDQVAVVFHSGFVYPTFLLDRTVSVAMGDIDGDLSVGLADAVIGLRVLAGDTTPGLVRADYAGCGCDVTGDDTVGLADVVHILQAVAGARVP